MAAPVVAGVLHVRLRTPFAGPAEWSPLVMSQLGRNDQSAAKVAGAWEQSAWVPGLRARRRPLEAGPVQSQEAWLLTERLESPARPAAP